MLYIMGTGDDQPLAQPAGFSTAASGAPSANGP